MIGLVLFRLELEQETGFEPVAVHGISNNNSHSCTHQQQQLSALASAVASKKPSTIPQIHPDLEFVISAWSALPDEIKRTIIKIIETST